MNWAPKQGGPVSTRLNVHGGGGPMKEQNADLDRTRPRMCSNVECAD